MLLSLKFFTLLFHTVSMGMTNSNIKAIQIEIWTLFREDFNPLEDYKTILVRWLYGTLLDLNILSSTTYSV